MSRVGTINKQPIEELDYQLTLEDWLAEGDTIATAVAALPDADTVVIDVFPAAASITLWVSGGVDGQEGVIEVTTTTTGGRIIQSEINLRIQEI